MSTEAALRAQVEPRRNGSDRTREGLRLVAEPLGVARARSAPNRGAQAAYLNSALMVAHVESSTGVPSPGNIWVEWAGEVTET